MRNLKSYLACLAVFALFLTSCSKDEPANKLDSDKVATVTFASLLSDMNDALNKQSDDALPACSSDTPAFAEISLTYGPGNTEVNVVVPIMMDGNGYFTAYDEDLEIPVPMDEDWVNISLNTFNVWNDNGMGAPGTVIWKAPMEGSEYDQFVGDALPILFDLRAGSKNYVDVEVLCFDDRMVNRYGYQFFDIIPEELRELCFFANYCTDAGRHFTANYDLDLYYFTGDNTEGTPLLTDLELFYSDRNPVTGVDGGAYYADPLCLAIPEPQMGEGAGEAYLYYEVTLTSWDDNYTFPAEPVVHTGFLSWNDIEALLDTDGDGDIEDNTDVNYWHVQLNCGTDDGGNGPVEGDADGDGVPDNVDQCPDTPEGAVVNSVGCPIDTDNDGVYNGIDQCPGTESGVEVNAVGCPIEEACGNIDALDSDQCARSVTPGDPYEEINMDLALPLKDVDDIAAAPPIGTVGVTIVDGVLTLTLDSTSGLYFTDYLVEVSDATGSTADFSCIEGIDLPVLDNGDAVEYTLTAEGSFSYPIELRVQANQCPLP